MIRHSHVEMESSLLSEREEKKKRKVSTQKKNWREMDEDYWIMITLDRPTLSLCVTRDRLGGSEPKIPMNTGEKVGAPQQVALHLL